MWLTLRLCSPGCCEGTQQHVRIGALEGKAADARDGVPSAACHVRRHLCMHMT